MDHLKTIVEKLPVTAVDTYLASGNVLFSAARRSATAWETMLADHLAAELGYAVPTLVRTRREVAQIVADAPWGDLWADAPDASTQVTLLAAPLEPERAAAIAAHRTATDVFAVRGREIYWRCAVKLTASIVWQQPKDNPLNRTSGTTRNLNTLQQLVARFPA